MKIGKLSNEQLQSIIMDSISYNREDVVLRSGIGEDCAGVSFGDEVCLLTTDPITGAASEVGKLAIHISCNDIASNGAAPVAILLTILAPEGTTEEELKTIMTQAHEEAKKLEVEIVGGHTEITNAVNRIIVSSTAIGKQKLNKLFSNKNLRQGDLIIMTKSAGLEGTGIIAYEKNDELKSVLSEQEIKTAKDLLDKISVVKEGIIAGGIGVTSMHDITEGGVLGAVWEICEGSQLGAVIKYEGIHIPEVTQKICDYYKLNPLRLISSGTMLMTIQPGRIDELMDALNEASIEAAIIGEITAKDVYLERRGRLSYVTPPDSDELYKVVF
ncbi:MAG: AIR synthase family protein [Clostridiales bacterium]|nr:AIR synthase family protein [Clostridiales bacterium]